MDIQDRVRPHTCVTALTYGRGKAVIVRKYRATLMTLALAALLGACGGGEGEATAGGRQLFEANCAACHGPEAKGTKQGPALVHEVYEPSHHSDDAFRSAVANGVQPHHWEFGPMPPVADLEPAEVDAIIEHVRGLQRDAGIE